MVWRRFVFVFSYIDSVYYCSGFVGLSTIHTSFAILHHSSADKKIAQKSRHSTRLNGGIVGANGHLTRISNGLSPETK